MNPNDSGRFCTESLESAAKRYKTLGFSIIPLNGARNPQQPKLPLIKWARFQHTHSSDDELHSWFSEQPDVGIGVVCGRVSRLMVLDFDDASGVSEFRHLCPDLVETFTVRSGTRKLPHFYYRLPEGKLIPTTSYPGVDLRGEGSYVVVPPTRIGEVAWTVELERPMREVSEFDLRRIMRFLTSRKNVVIEQAQVVDEISPITGVSEFRHPMSDEELVAYYRQRVGNGRNQALFQTALVARDTGITEAMFSLMMASVHASEPGVEHESYEARYAEAIRTIGSAYSRPARQQAKTTKGLGNVVREWLLGHGMANVARVIDGLYAVGIKAHELFTELEACQKLAVLKIGRRSVMDVLKAVVGEWRLFEVDVPPCNPPIDANAAKGSEDLNNSCEMSRGAKRVKNGRGRPSRLYQLPSSDEIAKRIGVTAKSDEVLTYQDFESPKAYRQALHAELLTRRPGHYGRAWLSARLGISRWTARRYEKAADIQVQPVFTGQAISWGLAATLPEKVTGSQQGVFIEASGGKRYPAIRGLALRLLKSGQTPMLKHQQGNFYRAKKHGVGIPTPYSVKHTTNAQNWQPFGSETAIEEDRNRSYGGTGIPPKSAHPEDRGSNGSIWMDKTASNSAAQKDERLGVGIPTPLKIDPTFYLCPECLNFHIMTSKPAACLRCGTSCEWEVISPTIWRDPQALKAWWSKRYSTHKQLKRERKLVPSGKVDEPKALSTEAKALTEKLHKHIPDLSFTNARNLVREFSEQLIEKALTVVKARKGLRSPAGFLVSFLRSESRLLSNNNKSLVSKKDKTGESAVDWLKRFAKSEYLSFISNVDDILKLSVDQPLTALEG